MPLSITRKDRQAVLIGGNIRVRIDRCRRGRAMLIIDAPRDVKVRREELKDKPCTPS